MYGIVLLCVFILFLGLLYNAIVKCVEKADDYKKYIILTEIVFFILMMMANFTSFLSLIGN